MNRRRRTWRQQPWCPAAGLRDRDCCAWFKSLMRSRWPTIAWPAIRKLPCDEEPAFELSQKRFRKSAVGLVGNEVKSHFNIGRIPRRQSRGPILQGEVNGKSCRQAEKDRFRRP